MEETKKIIDVSNRLYQVILAVIALVAVLVVGQIMYSIRALPQNTPHEISFTGDGKAYAKPDVAMISLGVTTQAVKSQDAVNQNNTKRNDIIKAVKDLGVDDKDIKTTQYNLYPVYGTLGLGGGGYSGGVTMIYPYNPGNDIVGYSLTQQVDVKIRNFDNINKIVDAATNKGANQVGSLQFTVDDIESVKAEARADAIKKAKQKAAELAKESGLSLGKLINVSEGYNMPYPVAYGLGMGGAGKETTVAPDIQAGQSEVDVTVTLTYQVR